MGTTISVYANMPYFIKQVELIVLLTVIALSYWGEKE